MVIETMYVNDMESKTATFASMQRRADHIFVFCLVFGIRVSETKIRRGDMFLEPPTPLPVTTLRSPVWLPIEIPTQLARHTVNLGEIFDQDYSGDAIWDVLTSMALSHCQIVRAFKTTPETKLMVVTVSVIANYCIRRQSPAFRLRIMRRLTKCLVISIGPSPNSNVPFWQGALPPSSPLWIGCAKVL